MIVYHGTSTKFLKQIRAKGLKNPYVTKILKDAADYAYAAVDKDLSGKPIVLMIELTKFGNLRYDGPAMNEPLSSAYDRKRNLWWNKAAREHPEWVNKKHGTVSIPAREWKYSWGGVGSAIYEGILGADAIRMILPAGEIKKHFAYE